LSRLKPYAQRLAAVTENPGKLTFKTLPDQVVERNCRGITVMSANLWHDWPRFRRLSERLSAFARLVEAELQSNHLPQPVER